MKKDPGLGARLEGRFRPALYWGAEFLAHSVRFWTDVDDRTAHT